MAQPSRYMQRTDSGQPWSQREQRRGQMFRDQHGRKYFAETEKKSGAPCGHIQPQYEAPLVVPAKYLEPSRDIERPYDLFINYERWIADTRTERADWFREGRNVSRKLQGERYDADAPFTGEVLEIIGPEPTPIEPILAASQGNPYVLGKSKKKDRRLARFFEIPEHERLRASEEDYSTLEALEEEHDPDATGGKRKDPRRNHHKKPAAEDLVGASA